MPELVPGRAELRHAQLPGGERVAYARTLVAELPLDDGRRGLLAIERRNDIDTHLPELARREVDPPAHAVAVGVAALRENHLGLAEAFRVDEQELVVPLVVARRDERRQRTRVDRVPEREVVLFHREDVREVRGELEPELERHRLHALVDDNEVILHPLADEALPLDREHVLRQTACERIAQKERRGEVFDLAGGKQQRRRAVDRQPQLRQEARVVGEEPVRLLAADVAAIVTDAERRALEDRQLRHSVRKTRPPDACAVALTTISSTFTCSGRVSAHITQSAMSSATIGCTPL